MRPKYPPWIRFYSSAAPREKPHPRRIYGRISSAVTWSILYVTEVMCAYMLQLHCKANMDCCCCSVHRCSTKAKEENTQLGDESQSTISQPPASAPTIDNECTEVDIEDSLEPDPSLSVAATVFRSIFHASPDNKLAMKLYGSERGILKEQERQDIECCNRWMIHPCSHFRWYWDVLVVMLLMFTVTVLPVSIAFYSDNQLKPEWLVINVLVDALFLSDIFVNFRTGIVMPDSDEVILNPRVVAKKYVRGWFAVDLLSSFPFDYVTLIATRGQLSSSLLKASRALRIIRLAKLLSLLRLLRISRLLTFMQRWEDLFDIAGGVLRILKLIVLMLLLAHWNGCIQFLIPVLQDVPGKSWIAINHLQNATVGEQYSWSLFKAISHMLCIGFGRWPPQNVTEAWLTIISMMVGATFYALFIGNMSTLLLSIDSSGRLYTERLNQVEEYMRYHKLPQDLRQRVQEFYEYRFQKKFFNEQAIMGELSQGLREDIVSHNCRELVTSVPFFQNASPQFVTAVLMKLKFEVSLKGEYIIHAGTKGDRMYFIRSGTVDVLMNDEEVATSLSDGSHFGEICLLTDDRRVATIKAATTCDLFSLSKKNFQAILEEYPEMRCAMEAVALRRLSKIGKKPPLEEIKKKGRISTTIEPPHISRNASHEDGKGKEKAVSYDGDQPCSSYSKTPKKKKLSRVSPPDSTELCAPKPPPGRVQPQKPLPSLSPLLTRPELLPITATRTTELQRQVKDPNFVNYSDDSSCESESTV